MIRYQKNPKGSGKIIEVDGRKYQAKYIGKGQYSKVYRVGDRVVYYTRGDCGKEVLAQFQYNRMTHLPELIRHENITTVIGTWYVFSSPYYRDVKKSDTSAYSLMREIVKVFDACSGHYGKKKLGIDTMREFVEVIRAMKFPRSIVRALYELSEIAGNCGENMYFDFHKKNFGVNEYGTLIFRDPMYRTKSGKPYQ